MPTLKNDRHALLPSETQSDVEALTDGGSGSSSADEEFAEEQVFLERKRVRRKSAKSCFKLLLGSCCCGSRRRHRSQHQIKRGLRLLFCSLLVPMCVIMLYLQLYTSIGTRRAPHRQWTFNTSRNVADYVLPKNDTTLLEPQRVCDDKVFLIIMVCSAVNNFSSRQIIRETWGNTSVFNYGIFADMHSHMKGEFLLPPKERVDSYRQFLHMGKNQTEIPAVIPVRVLFLLGRLQQDGLTDIDDGANGTLALKLRNEASQYNDLIQEDFIDSYSNLTIKTVLGLKWAVKHCLNRTAFFMKCDDDTFINVPNLLHFLLGGILPLYNDTVNLYDYETIQTWSPHNRLNQTSGYLAGYAFCHARPVADVNSKWYMPHYMYPYEAYPRYLSGASYLMSMDVVPRLYEAALRIQLVYIEDLYITGMCAREAHLKIVHQPLFGYLHSNKLCTYKGVFAQHYMTDETFMRAAYAFVSDANNRCSAPWLLHLQMMKRKRHDIC